MRKCRFVWLGTHKLFDAFTFAFEETEHGWIWAHAYRFAPDASTFIVECSEETWARFGFDKMSQDESIVACEKLFAKYLDGHRLQSNATHLVGSAAWLNFRRIKCERWNAGNVILLGDAAHTAHFSIGSGTKLALEDAIKLAEVLNRTRSSLSQRDGEGDHAQHGGGVTAANASDPSTMQSSLHGPPPHAPGSSAIAGRAATSSCSATPRTPRISRSGRGPSLRSRMRSSSRKF